MKDGFFSRHARQRFLLIGGACWMSSLAMAGQQGSPRDLPASYNPKSKRDPFVPLVQHGRLVRGVEGASGDVSELTLAGILWDPGGHSIALMNENELQVGDTISGYEVTEILQDAVVLIKDGKAVTLQLSFEGPDAVETASRSGKRR